MKIPSLPQRGKPVEQTVREIIGYLRWTNLVSVVGGELRSTPNGKTLTIKPGGTSSGAPPASPCHFGEIITIPDSDPPARGIRGGVIYCGDSIWNMAPQVLNLATAGAWLVSFEIQVDVNRDDDESVILPGIKTGTKPTEWTKTPWTEEADYPTATPPVAETGMATVIVPLGKLTITIAPEATTGTATFERVDCGHITLGHCAGTLNHTRG